MNPLYLELKKRHWHRIESLGGFVGIKPVMVACGIDKEAAAVFVLGLHDDGLIKIIKGRGFKVVKNGAA